MIENPRIIVVGNRQHSQQILQALLERDWNIVGAIGAVQNKTDEQSGYTSFNNLCEKEQIPLVETADITDSAVEALYIETEPDVCVCCGWTQIIPKSLFEAPTWGTVGLHLSPLPEGRGGAPVNWQIIHGYDEVTATLFRFVPEVDHGDILGQACVSVEKRDDISTIYPKLTLLSVSLVNEFLTSLSEGCVDSRSQSYDDATYYPQRKPKDGLIDWNRSPEFQWNWVRAQTDPYPGAFTFYHGQKLIIWEASVPEYQTATGEPGELLRVVDGVGLDIQTGVGIIRIKRIEFEGSPPMWADAVINHTELSIGSILGHPSHFPDWIYTGIRDSEGGFQYNTNIDCGDSAQVQAVCCSHYRRQDVRIEATLDGNPVLNTIKTIDGWVSETIDIQPTAGPHTLRVIFKTDCGSHIDTRYLKVYTNNSI